MKRTLALLLAAIMVFGMIPVSLITALAHGPGVGGNGITNQSITNALNQAIPETVTVDGDYSDTAWDKDEWLEVDARFGVWDVEDPLALSYSYKYQLRVDTDYLYGVFVLGNSSGNEITLWLNDGSDSSKCTDKIVFTLNGSSVTDTTVNGVSMADADTAAKALPAEKYQLATDTENASVIVEFRIFLKTFTESNTVSHFVSVKVGEESLYYPKMAISEEYPGSPMESWPSNAITIDRTDLEDANSAKHIPSDITIDGQLDEVVWGELTDYRAMGGTAHQQALEVKNNTSTVLNLLSVGYSTNNTTIPNHYHEGGWACHADNGCAGNIDIEKQLRFKYELRTDGTNLYGAIVLFDNGLPFDHNLPDGYTNNGVSDWEDYYKGLSIITIDFTDANGNALGTDGRKLELKFDTNAAKEKQLVSNLYDGSWNEIDDKTTIYNDDGTSSSVSISSAFDKNGAAGALRYTSHLVNFEFKIPLNYLADSLQTGSGTATTFKTKISAVKEGAFANVYNTTWDSTNSIWVQGTALESDDVRVWAKAETTVSTNNQKTSTAFPGYNYTINGGLQASEWNSLLAADYYVDSMYRSDAYNNGIDGTNAGNVQAYQYDIVADYDYLYGAAVIVTNTEFKSSDNINSANSFRLWLNNRESPEGTAYQYCVSFWLDASGDTRVSVRDNDASTLITYDKNTNGYYANIKNANDVLYGMDAKMRVLTAADLVNNAYVDKRAKYAELYSAIQAGKVAIVEFRVPLDAVKASMPYYRTGDATEVGVRYYTSVEDGIDANNFDIGICHPIQANANTSRSFRHFTPASWCTWNEKKIYNNQYFDNVVIDGMRTEHFWNDYSDFNRVNASTGYYGAEVSSNEVFTYGQTMYAGRDNLYGFAIFNGTAQKGKNNSNYTVYINNDPSYRTTATHTFTFYFDDNGDMQCDAYDVINGVAIDITDSVICAGNTLNGYSSLEFAINSNIFDPDNTGYEYTVSADNTAANGKVVTLYYPDPRDSIEDAFTDLLITHFNPEYVKHGTANIYPYGHTATSFNGYAAFYVVFEHVNGDIYKVVGVDSDGVPNYTAGEVPENGFLYSLYTTQTLDYAGETVEYNPTPERRAQLFENYKADFAVGNLIEFKGLDLNGGDLVHTQYRVFDKLLYVNKVDMGPDTNSGIILTDESYFNAGDTASCAPLGVYMNGWSNYFAFAPTATAGIYQLVEIDLSDGTAGHTISEFPEGGFIYSVRRDDAVISSVVAALGALPEGTYVHLDNFDLASFKALSGKEVSGVNFGYRLLAETAEGRNVNFPSDTMWDSSVAATIESLEFFFPETIEIDGYLNDTGWDEDNWTRVEIGKTGSLQTKNYEANGAQGFNYSYQIRSDGEYLYVAAILDVKSDGRAFWNSDNTLEYISVPHVRLWVKSNDKETEGYKDAISFTHLYDVRLGLDETSSQYKNWKDYTQTTITSFDLTATGQTSGDNDWYLKNTVVSGSEIAKYSTYNLLYEGVKLRWGIHNYAGYTHPWGGVADNYTGLATVDNPSTYGISAIFGETEEIMENMTSGAHGTDETWYAHTDTKGFSIANEHGMWRGSNENGYDQSFVEFKFKLSEIGCDDGDSFEYYIQAGASGIEYDEPFTMYSPAVVHTPYQDLRSFNAYNLPFWIWSSETSLKYNATTEYNMMLRNNYGPVVTLGAKVNDNFDGNGSNAIRFGGLYTEEYIRRQYVTNNKGDYATTDVTNWSDRVLDGANKDGITNYWDVAKVGIVVAITSRLTDADLTLETSGAQSADSVGIVDWVEGSNFADYEKYGFYVTLNGIPDTELDTKFSFRSYVDYYNVDGSPTYYDSILERSYNQVKNAGTTNVMPMPDDDYQGGEDGDDDTTIEVVKPNYNGMTIAYIPLDNRPVNVDRAIYLAQSAGFNLLMPDEELYATVINNFDTPDVYESSVGNPEALLQWLKDVENNEGGKYGEVDYYVISLDQLFSGGLVGSRDFAGINNLDGATTASEDTDGAFYDESLDFEQTIADYLAVLTSEENAEGEKENTVVYFDSQMRLASTGEFNGFSTNNDYSFFREYAMQERPAIDEANLTSEEWFTQIIQNYEKDVNGEYILGKSIYKRDANGDYVLDSNGNRQFADGIYSDTKFTYGSTTVKADLLDRYLKSRERKLKITQMLFKAGVVADAEYFYLGVDDSHPTETIQSEEARWIEAEWASTKAANNITSDNFKFFAGIDEVGLMSMAALVTKLYGSVDVAISYFGPTGAQNYPADEFGNNTLKENVDIHVEGVGANAFGTTGNKNALQILVLTRQTDADFYATEIADEYVTKLITTLKYNLANGIPTAVVDGSGGSRDKLARAMRDSDIDLGKVLGYSSWNTVANATGISVSNAIARYSYLVNSAEITEESHEGFFKQISYSLIKDIGYVTEFKAAWSAKSVPDGGTDSYTTDVLAKRMLYKPVFDETAEKLVSQLNESEIMTGIGTYEDIGDIRITKELYWPWNRMFEANFGLGVISNINLVQDVEYSYEGTASSGYEASLTDGVIADVFHYPGTNNGQYEDTWFAINSSVQSLVFDFADVTDVAMVRAHIYNGLDNGDGIMPAEKIEAFVLDSVSGEYVSIGELSLDSTTGAYYWAELSLDYAVETTSLRLDFTLKGSFIMLDEIEVY